MTRPAANSPVKNRQKRGPREIDLGRRFPELDGIRGLAILAIVLFHCAPTDEYLWASVAAIKNSLWLGVDLFFVLSGFLITRILLALRNARNSYRFFYARRILRIFPIYYLTLLLVFYLLSLDPRFARPIGDAPARSWYFFYAFNISRFFDGIEPNRFILHHFWSLCVEEQFYVIWPFLVLRIRSRVLVPLMIGIVLATPFIKLGLLQLGYGWGVLYSSTFVRMDGFALGGLAAWASINLTLRQTVPVCRALFYGSGAMLLASGVYLRGFVLHAVYTQVVVIAVALLFFATLIYLAVRDTAEKRALSPLLRTRGLRLLGRYSYGIYVYHWILQVILVHVGVFDMRPLGPWGSFAVVTSVVVALAVASYHLLEKPILSLKKFVVIRWSEPETEAVGARTAGAGG